MRNVFVWRGIALLLSELLYNTSVKVPNGIAIEENNSIYTYSDVYSYSKNIAGHLLTLGIKPGERIILFGNQRIEIILGELACIIAGIVPLLIPSYISKAQIDYLIKESNPTAIIFCPEYEHVIKEYISTNEIIGISSIMGANYFSIQEAMKESYLGEIKNYNSEESPAIVIFTTGTTGNPKGAIHSHKSILNWMGIKIRKEFIKPCKRILNFLSHVSGQFALWSSISEASCLVLPDKQISSPSDILDIVENKKITHVGLLGSLLRDTIYHPRLDKWDLNSLKMITFGSSLTSEHVIKRAMEVFPNVFLSQGYGLTECGMFVSVMFPQFDIQKGEEKLRSVGSVYNVLQYQDPLSVKIVDCKGNELPIGNVGEIVCKGKQTMLKYIGEDEQNVSSIDGWIKTGDLAYMDCDGYIYLVDRTDDVISIFNNVYYSQKLERNFLNYRGILDVSIVWNKNTKTLGIFIVADKNVIISREGILTQLLLDKSTFESIDIEIIFMDKLPRKTGRPNKIDKVYLRSMLEKNNIISKK